MSMKYILEKWLWMKRHGNEHKKLFFNSNKKDKPRVKERDDECGEHFMSSIPFIGSFVCTLYDARSPLLTLIISFLLLCEFCYSFPFHFDHTLAPSLHKIYTQRHCLSRTMNGWHGRNYRKMNIFDESLFMTQVTSFIFSYNMKWKMSKSMSES